MKKLFSISSYAKLSFFEIPDGLVNIKPIAPIKIDQGKVIIYDWI